MRQTLGIAVLLVTFSPMVAAQTPGRKPMEGAWKVAEIATTGAAPSNNPNPQPGLFIFGQRHYSIMWVPGNQPRGLSKAADETNEEKLQAYDSFLANAGTYEVSGPMINDPSFGRHESPTSWRGASASINSGLRGATFGRPNVYGLAHSRWRSDRGAPWTSLRAADQARSP